MYRVGTLLGLMLLVPVLVSAQSLRTVRHQHVELTFVSDRAYDHPVRDVRVEAVFEGPSGREVSLAAFWNGDSTYTVRFAPPDVGTWTYVTMASDATNAGLHGRRGTIEVTSAPADDSFGRHGWLRVSDDGRYLVHDDGTPFFYLADTAWEITRKATPEEIPVYLEDRKAKGFNAVQIVVLSHLILRPWGVKNRLGHPSFLNEDYSLPNPEYFAYLDTIVEAINEHGMVAVIVPLWAYMAEVQGDPEWGSFNGKTLTIEESLLLARYVGARYAGHNVIWIVGGDNQYDTPERRAFWSRFAVELQDASGDLHLTTVHPSECSASFEYFKDPEWLDFHMYQSGHVADAPCPYQLALQGFSLRPVKPVLNGEPVYEDLHHRFWEHLGQASPQGTFRMQAKHVRRAAYERLLSGALVGMSYGANSVWQWSTSDDPGGLWPRYTAIQGLSLPGSSHMTVLKQIMEDFDWYTLRPAPELVVDFGGYLPVAANDEYVLAYFASNHKKARVSLKDRGPYVRFYWIDPRTGERCEPVTLKAADLRVPVPLEKPGEGDWLLVIESISKSEAKSEASSPPNDIEPVPLRTNVAPNPFLTSAELHLDVIQSGTLELRVWDALGREVMRSSEPVSPARRTLRIDVPVPGVYLYHVTLRSNQGCPYVDQGTMVSLGR